MTKIWKRVKNKRVWKVDRSIYLKDFVVACAVRGLFPKTGVFFFECPSKASLSLFSDLWNLLFLIRILIRSTVLFRSWKRELFTHPLYQGSVLIYWEPVMIFLSCFLERKIFLLLCLIYVMKLLVNFNSFWKISIYFESLISPIKELLLTKFVPSRVMNVVISCI